jgi:polyhydroxybutyrate depolymerase
MRGVILKATGMVIVGLSMLHAASGIDVNGSVTYAGIAHEYLLHIPPTYVIGTATPLIVSLHGRTWAIADYKNVDNLSQTSDTAGFLLVYPQGWQKSWDSGPLCCNGNTLDDVGFIRALIDTLSAHYTIDHNRVYAVGCSNGGMMANRLGADAADVFAAVCGVAGPLALSQTDTECHPSRPVSVLDFHSLDDGVVPYGGGDLAPAETLALARWAAADSCDIEPTTRVYNSQTTVKTWKKSNSRVEVVLYTAQTGGHWWPPSYVPANSILWSFFKNHPLADSAQTTNARSAVVKPRVGQESAARSDLYRLDGRRLAPHRAATIAGRQIQTIAALGTRNGVRVILLP